jgi:hypothetical protein
MEPRKSSLTQSQRCLVTVMQRLHYGRILDLVVRDGEAVLHPSPQVVQEVRLGATPRRPNKQPTTDFSLKAPVVDLLRRLKRLGNGTVDVLEIRDGLPFRMHVRSTVTLSRGQTLSTGRTPRGGNHGC